jgi:hypothetical protein
MDRKHSNPDLAPPSFGSTSTLWPEFQVTRYVFHFSAPNCGEEAVAMYRGFVVGGDVQNIPDGCRQLYNGCGSS